ncbi:MAG: putative Ig domain-containing protein [Synergistaceae bacterium]|nr:putative Ig domain-containing protein [Synergistaceae bacterium]
MKFIKMRKVLSVILSCIILVMTASSAFAVVYGQAGYENYGYDEDSAWEISSAAVLAKVRDDVNSGNSFIQKGYFKLTKDIDLTGYTDWEAIGSYTGGLYHDAQFFNGHFDGNGHTIKVKISKIQLNEDIPWESYCALFGVVTGDGTIKNLNVEGSVSFSARTHVQRYFVSGIVAYLCGGSVENCKFDGSVSANQLYDDYPKVYAGGIVGYAGGYGGFYGSSAPDYYSIIKNCKVGSKSDTTVKSNARGALSNYIYAGGITAYFEDSNNKSVMSGNWAKVTLNAGTNDNTGAIFAGRSGFKGKISNNTEVDPDEPEPDPEPEELEMTTSFKSTGKVKVTYTGTAEITGGTAPYEWDIDGELPPGLKLKASGATAKITGKPTKAGEYSFTLIATDDNGESVEEDIDIEITGPEITGNLSNGVIKKSYSATLKASGGTASYTWTKSSGTLPTGLKLNKSSGKISGTPTEAGKFTFKVKVTDKNGATATKSFTMTITAPKITGTLKNGTVKKSYSVTLKASGGTASYTWTKSSGTLPTGLKLNKTSGKISGTPTKAGKFTFKVKVTDKNGATATKSYTVTIKAASNANSSENENAENSNELKLNVDMSQNNNDVQALPNVEPELSAVPPVVNAALHVVGDNILHQGTERDEDIIEVKANEPVKFQVKADASIDNLSVYIDDELTEDIIVSEDGTFTLPEEFIHEDFKVQVKGENFKTQELYIIAIEQ